MRKNNARFIAIETLRQLDQSKTPLPILFQRICKGQQLGGLDRSLAMNIIYGVLRQHQYLELLIGTLCKIPKKKLHPLVRHGLRVGLYQIFFLDRIPESAAVNETVNALKATHLPKRLYGFVNGVLRQSIRQKSELPQPMGQVKEAGAILNHPEWLTSRWAANFGTAEMQAICAANNQQQDLTLRVNLEKTSPREYCQTLGQSGIEAQPGRYSPEAVTLQDYQGTISALPDYAEDYFQVQGESAQLVTYLLAPIKKNGLYLDGCAGLGGKTRHLLEMVKKKEGRVIAVEPEHHRQEKLLQNLENFAQSQTFTLFQGPLQDYGKTKPPFFDGILIDAPCSGTGVTGRHPDIRWRRQPADIARYAVLQLELLTLASTWLQSDGVLVYATCSLEPEENVDIIKQFIQNNPSFTITDCAAYLPREAVELSRDKFFQPHPSDGTDGFFAARLVRNIADD